MKNIFPVLLLVACAKFSQAQITTDSTRLSVPIVETNNEAGKTTVAYPDKKDTVVALEQVEVEAQFPGGLEGWKNYLMKTINPDAAMEAMPPKAKRFKETVIVRFIVCKDGSLCDIGVVNKVSPRLKAEAEKAIRNSPNWIPAKQNGKAVKAYRKQPITFVVD